MKRFGFQWHITDRCNLRCRHCYQDIFSSEREVPIERLKEFADKIFGRRDIRVSVNITGGEPLLYKEILTLLEYIDHFESCSDISIITNGTFIDENLISGLMGIKHLKHIKISVESADEKTNDRIRGEGNLGVVIRNLNEFRRIKKDIVLMVTLASYNYRDVSKVVDFAKRNRLSGIIFERFVPLGSGRGLKGEFLKGYEYRSVVEEILRLSGLEYQPEELIAYKAFWIILKNSRMRLRGAFCNLGSESMALMPDGSVYPCRRFVKRVANLKTQSFDEVLSLLKGYEIKSFKERLSGEICKRCTVEGCIGCRALVYALTGDENGDDLQCYV